MRQPRRDRLDKRQLFEALRRAGYAGGYDAVRRYARRWADIRTTKTEAKASEAFIPLTFAPAEAYQFDWSEEWIILDGIAFKAQVAHARLCHSRMPYIRAYPRQSQEMMFDAHARAFAFWGGACERGIYDNMKTAVDAVFVGKERKFNRRFAQMCSHYLVEPTACTPAAGWEMAQVENQVGSLRQRLFIPRPHVKTLEELNRRLEDGCIAYARESRHPDDRERTVWEAFEAERPRLCQSAGPSTDSARSMSAPRRPVWSASIATATALRPRPPTGRSSCGPMPIGSSSALMARWSPRMSASSAATVFATTRCTICRSWPASPAPCAMGAVEGLGAAV